jgi:hypothetical protein
MFDPAAAARTKAARRRFQARELLRKLKTGPCEDCGNPDLQSCQMDLWKDEGTESPSRMLLLSLKRIAVRAAECTLLCANCSRLRTWNLDRFRRSGPT